MTACTLFRDVEIYEISATASVLCSYLTDRADLRYTGVKVMISREPSTLSPTPKQKGDNSSLFPKPIDKDYSKFVFASNHTVFTVFQHSC